MPGHSIAAVREIKSSLWATAGGKEPNIRPKRSFLAGQPEREGAKGDGAEQEGGDDVDTVHKVACKPLGQGAVVLLLVGALVMLVVSVNTLSFRFEFKGLAHEALLLLGVPTERSYSVWSLGESIRASA